MDTHTVKDISFTQDGNVVTVTATTQNNSSQSWVFTLPDISVDKLYTTILISSTKSWEQTDHSFSSGGANYIHNVKVSTSNGYQLNLKILSSRIDKYTNVTSIEFTKFIGGYYRNETRQYGIMDSPTVSGSSINYLAVSAGNAAYLDDTMLEILDETVTKV